MEITKDDDAPTEVFDFLLVAKGNHWLVPPPFHPPNHPHFVILLLQESKVAVV